MGLPLYRAPVESDIKSKIPKDPPTRARSSIRRLRRTVGAILHHNGVNSPAGRFLARRSGGRNLSNPTADSPWTPWDSLEPNVDSIAQSTQSRFNWRRADSTAPYPIPHDPVRPSDSARTSTQSDPALREVFTRSGMSPDVVRYFGERMARLHADTSSRTPDDVATSSAPLDQDPRPWVIATDGPNPPPRQTSRSQSSSRFDRPPLRTAGQRSSSNTSDDQLHGVRIHLDGRITTIPPPRGLSNDGPQESHFDGLGDRDRSLSPEGDGVWDTLLSSITPDPQPPSVGTSFASTSAPASAATSQTTSNSARSSNTSLTAPATRLTPFDFDFPCESSGETDTEGDDEEETGENTLRRFGRSYADVVARSRSHTQTQSQREDDDLLSVDSMQRIVRNLARREDIPDEWWAEAGLSRSQLPREAA